MALMVLRSKKSTTVSLIQHGLGTQTATTNNSQDYDQWPIGIAAASDGRLFASYTRGDYRYTLGVIVNETAEEPYPSLDLNLPVSQLNTSWNGIAFGSGNSSAFGKI